MNDAERFLADLQSPYWWLTAVVLALVVNIASSYLRPAIDSWRERRTSKRQSIEEQNAAKLELWARFLLEDDKLLILRTSRLQSLKIELLTISCILLAELTWLYFVQVRPTSASGWIALVAFLVLVAMHAMELLWHKQDIQKATHELKTVQRLLQDRVLNSTRPKSACFETFRHPAKFVVALLMLS